MFRIPSTTINYLKFYKLSLPLLCLFSFILNAQDTIPKQLPADYLVKVSSRIDNLSSKLDKKSEKALNALGFSFLLTAASNTGNRV